MVVYWQQRQRLVRARWWKPVGGIAKVAVGSAIFSNQNGTIRNATEIATTVAAMHRAMEATSKIRYGFGADLKDSLVKIFLQN